MQILVEALVLWCTAGSIHDAYAVETSLNQLASEAEKDPCEIGIGF